MLMVQPTLVVDSNMEVEGEDEQHEVVDGTDGAVLLAEETTVARAQGSHPQQPSTSTASKETDTTDNIVRAAPSAVLDAEEEEKEEADARVQTSPSPQLVLSDDEEEQEEASLASSPRAAKDDREKEQEEHELDEEEEEASLANSPPMRLDSTSPAPPASQGSAPAATNGCAGSAVAHSTGGKRRTSSSSTEHHTVTRQSTTPPSVAVTPETMAGREGNGLLAVNGGAHTATEKVAMSPFKLAMLTYVQKLSPRKRLRGDQIDFERLQAVILGELNDQKTAKRKHSAGDVSTGCHASTSAGGMHVPKRPPLKAKVARSALPMCNGGGIGSKRPTTVPTHLSLTSDGAKATRLLDNIGQRTHRIVEMAQRSQRHQQHRLTASISSAHSGATGAVASSSSAGGVCRSRRSESSSSSAAAVPGPDAATVQQRKLAKRLSDVRRRRREALESAEQLIQIDCDLRDRGAMAAIVRRQLTSMLRGGGSDGEHLSSVKIYQIVRNTLHHCFDRDTFTELVPKSTRDFIREYLLKSTNELKCGVEGGEGSATSDDAHDHYYSCADSPSRTRRMLTEFEVQVLFELAAVEKDNSSDRRSDDVRQAVQKLRAISLLGSRQAGYLNEFLETLVDEFLDTIPYHLVEVYDQIGAATLPADLSVFAASSALPALDVPPLTPSTSVFPVSVMSSPASPTFDRRAKHVIRKTGVNARRKLPVEGGVRRKKVEKGKQESPAADSLTAMSPESASSSVWTKRQRQSSPPPSASTNTTSDVASSRAPVALDAGALTPHTSLPCDSRLLRRLIVDCGPPPSSSESSSDEDGEGRSGKSESGKKSERGLKTKGTGGASPAKGKRLSADKRLAKGLSDDDDMEVSKTTKAKLKTKRASLSSEGDDGQERSKRKKMKHSPRQSKLMKQQGNDGGGSKTKRAKQELEDYRDDEGKDQLRRRKLFGSNIATNNLSRLSPRNHASTYANRKAPKGAAGSILRPAPVRASVNTSKGPHSPKGPPHRLSAGGGEPSGKQTKPHTAKVGTLPKSPLSQRKLHTKAGTLPTSPVSPSSPSKTVTAAQRRAAFLAEALKSSEKKKSPTDVEADKRNKLTPPSAKLRRCQPSPDKPDLRPKATASRNLFEALSPVLPTRSSGAKATPKSPARVAKTAAVIGADELVVSLPARAQENTDASYQLPAEAIEGYKEHVQRLRQAKYKGQVDADEVFYGRGRSRENVFDRPPAEGPSSVAGTRLKRSTADDPQTSGTLSAKNRAGRKVSSASDVFHVAHYLLNVANANPGCPVAPKSLALKLKSPLKLQRLLRLPSKARRRKLGRMLEKNLAEVSTPSMAQQIQPPAHFPSTTTVAGDVAETTSTSNPTSPTTTKHSSDVSASPDSRTKEADSPVAVLSSLLQRRQQSSTVPLAGGGNLSVDIALSTLDDLARTIDQRDLRRIERTLMLSPRNGGGGIVLQQLLRRRRSPRQTPTDELVTASVNGHHQSRRPRSMSISELSLTAAETTNGDDGTTSAAGAIGRRRRSLRNPSGTGGEATPPPLALNGDLAEQRCRPLTSPGVKQQPRVKEEQREMDLEGALKTTIEVLQQAATTNGYTVVKTATPAATENERLAELESRSPSPVFASAHRSKHVFC